MYRPENRTPFTTPKKIAVIEGAPLLSGTRTVVGFIHAGVLIPDGFEIPYYNNKTKEGYQRPPQELRINQLANDLRRGRTDLPTAVLLNIRNQLAKQALDRNFLDLEHLKGLNSPLKFHVVDGQHRILALQKLVEEDRDRWAQFLIPFVCLLGASQQEEMNQFYIVNSTAKSVRTDLAMTLLLRRVEQDGDVYKALQERGREWMADGQKLVERLAKDSAIWKHAIRLPGMEKADTTIPSASMVNSLKPLLLSPFFGGLKDEHQIKVLDAYWHGIREIMRPAFDSPTSYSIQKGIGVLTLHGIFPYVLEIVRSRGLSITDSASYKDVLEPALLGLQGDTPDGDPIEGIDFWAAAPKGAAGTYSSSAGRRVLMAKLKQLLPSVEVE